MGCACNQSLTKRCLARLVAGAAAALCRLQAHEIAAAVCVQYMCPKDIPKPGQKCRDAYHCELSAVYDTYCNCPHNYRPANYVGPDSHLMCRTPS
jgi:hypothetical protein